MEDSAKSRLLTGFDGDAGSCDRRCCGDPTKHGDYDITDSLCHKLTVCVKRLVLHSGCGCSASVLSAYILPEMANGRYKKVLFIASGAMMSPDMIKQGESIPAIGHLLLFESDNKASRSGYTDVQRLMRGE